MNHSDDLGLAGLILRAARDTDDLDGVNAGNRLWMGAEQERRMMAAMPPEHDGEITVAALHGELVGCGVCIAAPAAAYGYGMASLHVVPTARSQGVGTALFDRAVALATKQQLAGLMLSVPDESEVGVQAARARGLVEHGHHVESALDLLALDDELAARAAERAAQEGCQLVGLPDDADEDRWLQVFEFLADRLKESPDARDGGGNMPYSIFRSMIVEPWQALLATRGDELLGITALMVRPDAPYRLNTMFTGVHPDGRGQGLAAALKSAHAVRVRDRGWREILTQNMDQNAPILAVNRRMGFVPVAGTWDFGLALNEPSQG